MKHHNASARAAGEPHTSTTSGERATLQALAKQVARQNAELEAALDGLRELGDASIAVPDEMLEEIEHACQTAAVAPACIAPYATRC